MILRLVPIYILLLTSICNAQKIALVLENNRFGYIDYTGEYIIEPQFKNAKSFSENGLAPVKKNRKWGYINIEGAWIIQPQFNDAELFGKDADLAPVKPFGTKNWGFINKKGVIIIRPKLIITPYLSFNRKTKGFLGSVAMVKYNNKWGFATKQGTFLGNKQFNKVNIFVEIKKK